ncbi:MAG: CPBP family intramembrane glutamic endopeptidase [Butyricicoccaceae bacterium]
MKKQIKKSLLFALAMVPFAAVGGYFTGIYAYQSYTADLQQQIIAQAGNYQTFLLIAALQSICYAFAAGLFGSLLAEAVGLMKPFRWERKPLLRVSTTTLILGILFAADYWTFGSALPELAAVYESGILHRSFSNWMASVFYGGIIEELLMRLFLMSLLAFLLWKLLFRRCDRSQIPTGVFVAANVISALLFAAGHLPTTVGMFGGLTPLIVLRCFLFNGCLGIMFGRFYRKYGIQYAMLAHMGCHIISKLIWLALI